jgi:trans-aconitate methyltransferase
MNLSDRATIIRFHRERIATFGAGTVEALGWRGPDSQRLRFEAIAQAVDFTDASVLDAGCGTGDLKSFLDSRYPGVRYFGIDQIPEFIGEARARYAGDASAAFVEGHFTALALPRADHVVASGVFAYRSANPRYLEQTIARLFSAALRSFSFNVLDARHFPDHPLLLGRDVDAVLAFCRQLSGDVRLIDGYAKDDATVVMRVDG